MHFAAICSGCSIVDCFAYWQSCNVRRVWFAREGVSSFADGVTLLMLSFVLVLQFTFASFQLSWLSALVVALVWGLGTRLVWWLDFFEVSNFWLSPSQLTNHARAMPLLVCDLFLVFGRRKSIYLLEIKACLLLRLLVVCKHLHCNFLILIFWYKDQRIGTDNKYSVEDYTCLLAFGLGAKRSSLRRIFGFRLANFVHFFGVGSGLTISSESLAFYVGKVLLSFSHIVLN